VVGGEVKKWRWLKNEKLLEAEASSGWTPGQNPTLAHSAPLMGGLCRHPCKTPSVIDCMNYQLCYQYVLHDILY
jgi:hypothetical protein